MKILVIGASRSRVARSEAGLHHSAAIDAPMPGDCRADACACVALSTDDRRWVLLNVVPAVSRHPILTNATRNGDLTAVVLLDAHLEHSAGLPALCQAASIDLHATPGVFEELMAREPRSQTRDGLSGLRWHPIPVAGDTHCWHFAIESAGLRLCAVAVGGRAEPYSPHRREPVVGDRIALLVEDVLAGRRLFYSPCTPGAEAVPWMRNADCVLVHAAHDRAPATEEKGEAEATWEPWFEAPDHSGRKVLIGAGPRHWVSGTSDAGLRRAEAAGVELAYDGMEIDL